MVCSVTKRGGEGGRRSARWRNFLDCRLLVVLLLLLVVVGSSNLLCSIHMLLLLLLLLYPCLAASKDPSYSNYNCVYVCFTFFLENM